MEKLLRPARFEGKPDTTPSQWKHWLRTFEFFLTKAGADNNDRLALLVNHISEAAYKHISDCITYTSAVAILKSVYDKP